MRLLLANVPYVWYDGAQIFTGPNAGSRWPFLLKGRTDYACFPFFMANAVTYLQAHGVDTRFYDGVAQYHYDYDKVFSCIIADRPDVLVLEIATPTKKQVLAMAERVKAATGCKIVLVGPHVPTYAKELLALPFVDHCVKGEYEQGCLAIARGDTRRLIDYWPVDQIDTLDGKNWLPHWPDYMGNYWDQSMATPRPQHPVSTSRGCVFKCLAGDTPINTVEGMIPIKDLVGKRIGVFTFEKAESRAKVCWGQNVRKYGENEKLVRVSFDDGTHIDCTPDHQFIAFGWGNQFKDAWEEITEAKDLKPGAHVKAIKESRCGPKRNYVHVRWGRKSGESKHRMVMEWMVGRNLLSEEEVHHEDRNPGNNLPGNLKLTKSSAEHFSFHPEIAERMRQNNPAKNMTPEWREKIGKAVRGLKRSDATRARMAEGARRRYENPEERRKTGERSANRVLTDEARANMAVAQRKRYSRPEEREKMRIVNHRVVSVEWLPGLHDVYCLEVPDTGWFYANNVLVKNCTFCQWPEVMNDRKYRVRSPEMVIDEIEQAKRRFKIGSLFFDDDTWNTGTKRVKLLCDGLKRIGLPWTMMGRADSSVLESYQWMQDAGCVGMRFGVESFHQHLLDRVEKHMDGQKNYENLAWLAQNMRGMEFHLTTMVNMPGEQPGEWEQDLEKLNRLKDIAGRHGNRLHWQTSECQTFPGTKLWQLTTGKSRIAPEPVAATLER